MQCLRKLIAEDELLPTMGQASVRTRRGCRDSSSAPCWVEDDARGLQEGWKLDIVRSTPEGEGTEDSYKTVYFYIEKYKLKKVAEAIETLSKQTQTSHNWMMGNAECSFHSFLPLAKGRCCTWHLVCKEILAWMKKSISNFNAHSQVINIESESRVGVSCLNRHPD